MSTVSDLLTDASAALSGLGIPSQASGYREEQRVAVDATVSRFRMIESEVVDSGSNTRTTIVVTETEVIARSSGLLSADRATEELVTQLCELVADPDFWTAMDSVRSSPLPEIEYSEEIERIGQVYRGTIRAEVSLERGP